MSIEKTTATKKNAYKIQVEVSQAIFKLFLQEQCGEFMRGSVFAMMDRPLLSSIANLATNAIMRDPRVNVVLRKY